MSNKKDCIRSHCWGSSFDATRAFSIPTSRPTTFSTILSSATVLRVARAGPKLSPNLRYELGMIVEEGDIVMVHGRYIGWARSHSSRSTSFACERKARRALDVMQEEVPASATASGKRNVHRSWVNSKIAAANAGSSIRTNGRRHMQLSLKEAQGIVELARVHAERIAFR